jgi:hypothetical protein
VGGGGGGGGFKAHLSTCQCCETCVLSNCFLLNNKICLKYNMPSEFFSSFCVCPHLHLLAFHTSIISTEITVADGSKLISNISL